MTSFAFPPPLDEACDCRAHRPGDEVYDAEDTDLIAHVGDPGWHVVGVYADEDGPAFAYTVGLWHRARQPELFMSGLEIPLMHRVLNHCVDRLLAGEPIRPGWLGEGVLSGVPVTVEDITVEALLEQVPFTHWFHRRPVPARQIVYPDTLARFAWQADASPSLDLGQPPQWRVPGPRTGLLATTPDFPDDFPYELLALTCTHVAEERASVTFVSRENLAGDDEWTVLCSDTEHTEQTLEMVHLAHLLRCHPSLGALGVLPSGSEVHRADGGSPWIWTSDTATT